jgi:hypothetical protein
LLRFFGNGIDIGIGTGTDTGSGARHVTARTTDKEAGIDTRVDLHSIAFEPQCEQARRRIVIPFARQNITKVDVASASLVIAFVVNWWI